MPKHRIRTVDDDSIAQELGIEPGDYLVSIDDQPVLDVLDYRYKLSSERMCAAFESKDGQQLTVEIEKYPEEDLGLTFELPMMMEKRSCANRCMFCFIDQLPKNVRQTLCFKDDDWRLSFLQGNFVTLTNVGDRELDRIIAQHISPLNISVHTTDEALRVRMLQNNRAALINRQLTKLVQGHIAFYAQIVLCPGLNDGEQLSKTLMDLSALRPYAKGVAIVPIGLTEHRKGLTELRPVHKADALDAIARVEAFMRTQEGDFAHLADEFYLLAQKPIPSSEAYGEFAQLEDGVGMLRYLIDGFEDALSYQPSTTEHTLSIATGEAAYPTIRALCDKAEEALSIRIYVYPIKNRFFGGGVNVTGLLTGLCLREGLVNKPLGERLLLSKSTTRNGEAVFLDDMTVSELSMRLNVPIELVENDGASLVDALISERE